MANGNITEHTATAGVTTPVPDATAAPVDAGTKEHSEATGPNPTKRQAKTRTTKAQRARHPLFVLIACLCYLSMALSFVHNGLHGVRAILQPRLRDANFLARAYTTKHRWELSLNMHLETLVSTPLEKHSFEDHDECLARGITLADAHFGDFPYDIYPDILNATMEWVEDNCAKLIFTPQVHPEPGSYTLLRASWATITEKSQTVIHVLKNYGSRIKNWLETNWLGKEPHAHHEVQVQHSAGHEQESFKRPLLMPHRFKLVCGDSPVCHLEYNPPAEHAALLKKATEDVVKDAQRKAVALSTYTAATDNVLYWNKAAQWISIPLEIVAILTLTAALWYGDSPDRSTAVSVKGVGLVMRKLIAEIYYKDMQVLLFLIVQIICIPPMCGERTFPPGRTSENVVVLSIMSGVGLIIPFFFPFPSLFPSKDRVENIVCFVGAVVELYNVLRESEDGVSNAKDEKITEDDSPADGGRRHTPSSDSKLPRRQISPETSLQQDIEEERQAMREELAERNEEGGWQEARGERPMKEMELGSDTSSEWSVVEQWQIPSA
ncbi:hypothetical protein BU26DRAFT_271318 [Trematosphaeria pertusa]|uniref:Uncharacterized protein n=1 Tax=Trematosphaeria pertusa TaxID=390896 RepID=A0A6A6IKD2_9PLEO|nr:uncharacterized protein BU26DRAFT_271318 [Trematosphaeria pertusa]KAF2250846.1 hypothetical protein BU26DRAFT_271318 [Trematosphaeria pertusa]